MARPRLPARTSGTAAPSPASVSAVTGAGESMTMASSSQVFRPGRRTNPKTDRNSIAKPWQIEAYRHVNFCGEARYAVTLFAATAGRAEIGVSLPQTLQRKAVWADPAKAQEEIAALAELAPTVRERSKLIRDYMTHRVIAGECYLVARDKVDTDPGYDLDPNAPIWEIVAVTEIQKIGEMWRVRHENGNYIDLKETDPVIRLWSADPENRIEAWSPFRSLLPTLREIEFLTRHIFAQVRSRLMSAGVWFLPDNLTFPPPPPDAVEGGDEAIAAMNEAEQFMASLAASGMGMLEDDEVSFPTIVMADPASLAAVDQDKLIKFWSEIDDKAMTLRSSAVRRFALGMDLPPEQILGSSGLAVDGSGGSAGSVNHWGVWANEEQTISAHIEPALDDLVGTLTDSFLRIAVEGTSYVIGYDTASLRLRQDRSKEALELNARGLLNGAVTLRENGFDPESDLMGDEEFKKWVLMKMIGGSPTPEQVAEAVKLLTGLFMPAETGSTTPVDGRPGRNEDPSLEDHPYEGPPREQHDHSPAPFGARQAAAEVLVLRALEKAGNVLLNSGKRGRDKDRTTPSHLAHVSMHAEALPKFDFSLASTIYDDLTAEQLAETERQLGDLCTELYRTGAPYTRERLVEAVKGL